MRYLRKYNESKAFIQNSPIKSEIEDILLELTDIGFGALVRMWYDNPPGSRVPNEFCKVKVGREEKFTYSQIEDVIERIKDFLTDYDFYVYNFTNFEKVGGGSDPMIAVELYRAFNRWGDGRWSERSYYFEIVFKGIPNSTIKEELSPSTYLSAAEKLKKLGHKKRPESLTLWSEEIKKRERDAKIARTISEAKKLGIYNFNFVDFSADCYLFLTFADYDFPEMMDEYNSGSRNNIWLRFMMSFIPADEESFEKMMKKFKNYQNAQDGKFHLQDIVVNLTEGTDPDDDLKPSGSLYFEDFDFTNFKLTSRRDAVKFKKMIIDLFETKIIFNDTPSNPGGLIEKVREEICNEWGISFSCYLNFVESLKRINLNILYKD
jgi:hypothetical protein